MCRVEAEQAVREALYPLDAFEPVSRDDGERWIVRYYDRLKEPSATCALQADKLLTLLSLPTRPLECTNAAKQGDGWSCGYWVRFFAKRKCGEIVKKACGLEEYPQQGQLFTSTQTWFVTSFDPHGLQQNCNGKAKLTLRVEIDFNKKDDKLWGRGDN